jgi:hypothetical protein
MPVLDLDVVEPRGDQGGPVGVTGEEDVLGQIAWPESDVVLPFSDRERDAGIRVRQDLVPRSDHASLARNSGEDRAPFSRAST